MFKPVLRTKPLKTKTQIKVGDILRTYYGEDLLVTSVEWVNRKGAQITANRSIDGKPTGTISVLYALKYDVTHLVGYQAGNSPKVWERVAVEWSNGHLVEMFRTWFGTPGKRGSVEKWEIERDHEYAGYAVNPRDAVENFNRVVNGYVLNPSTGNYEKAED